MRAQRASGIAILFETVNTPELIEASTAGTSIGVAYSFLRAR